MCKPRILPLSSQVHATHQLPSSVHQKHTSLALQLSFPTSFSRRIPSLVKRPTFFPTRPAIFPDIARDDTEDDKLNGYSVFHQRKKNDTVGDWASVSVDGCVEGGGDCVNDADAEEGQGDDDSGKNLRRQRPLAE